MQEYERGRKIDPDNRLIAKVSDADFFLIHDREAPQSKCFMIKSTGKNVSLSLSNSTIEAALSDLGVWATNHKRCLLTYSIYPPSANNSN